MSKKILVLVAFILVASGIAFIYPESLSLLGLKSQLLTEKSAYNDKRLNVAMKKITEEKFKIGKKTYKDYDLESEDGSLDVNYQGFLQAASSSYANFTLQCKNKNPGTVDTTVRVSQGAIFFPFYEENDLLLGQLSVPRGTSATSQILIKCVYVMDDSGEESPDEGDEGEDDESGEDEEEENLQGTSLEANRALLTVKFKGKGLFASKKTKFSPPKSLLIPASSFSGIEVPEPLFDIVEAKTPEKGSKLKPLAVVCGNNSIELPDEQCDDGNTDAGDGCDASCQAEICGNAKVENNESCDDGNFQGGDGCSSMCNKEECGNHIQDANEDCDDGNTEDGDGCSATCTPEESLADPTSGQASPDAAEQTSSEPSIPSVPRTSAPTSASAPSAPSALMPSSDSGDVSAPKASESIATPPPRMNQSAYEYCGDNSVQKKAGEECDDGNFSLGDGCSARCKKE